MECSLHAWLRSSDQPDCSMQTTVKAPGPEHARLCRLSILMLASYQPCSVVRRLIRAWLQCKS